MCGGDVTLEAKNLILSKINIHNKAMFDSHLIAAPMTSEDSRQRSFKLVGGGDSFDVGRKLLAKKMPFMPEMTHVGRR